MASRGSRGTRARIRSLSAREKEVLSLLAQGLTGVEIAERLYLSPETVRTHVRNAMTKLNASTRAHAIALAIKGGEISLDGV
jgi:DNA-binding CsgD family transcriptional regulator